MKNHWLMLVYQVDFQKDGEWCALVVCDKYHAMKLFNERNEPTRIIVYHTHSKGKVIMEKF